MRSILFNGFDIGSNEMSKRTEIPVAVFYEKQYQIFRYFALWKLPKYTNSRLVQISFGLYYWHIVIFWMLLFDASMLVQVISNIASLNEIVKVFFIFATAIGVRAKFYSVKKKSLGYLRLFALMHSADLLPLNMHERRIYAKTLLLSRVVRNIYAGLSLSALNALLLTQYLIDSSELPLSAYIPIDVSLTWSYCIVYLFQYVSLSVCCLVNIAFDSLATSFFIYVRGQLDILAYRLKNIGRDHDNSQEFVNLQLKDCVRYYSKILHLTEVVEDLVSIPISVQILCSVLVLIANFYAMSLLSEPGDYANFMKFVIYQGCMLTQIFILCYFANEVSERSSELSYALYSSEWFFWNKVDRKLMLLMMLRFDTPIRIKSINRCYSFNLAAFTSIVNSSYSYFALLKRMNS